MASQKQGLPTIHTRRLQPCYLEAIREGKKTVEARLATEKTLATKEQDIISFSSTDESLGAEQLKVQVTRLSRYATFEALLKDYLAECLPGVSNVEEGCEIYRKIYSKEEEQKFGVVAIHIKLIE